MPAIQLRISHLNQFAHAEDVAEPIELGRQTGSSELLYRLYELPGATPRLVIAGREENAVSRKHALLDSDGDGHRCLTNLSTSQPIRLEHGVTLAPGERCQLTLPVVLVFGNRSVQVLPIAEPALESMTTATRAPGSRFLPDRAGRPPLQPNESGFDVESIIHWLEAVMDVLQSAVNSADFFRKASRTLVDMIGLTNGRVLLYDARGGWATAARYPDGLDLGTPSRQIVDRLLREGKTFWQGGEQQASSGNSLAGVEAVVAAPILDRTGTVIGALYGDRRSSATAAPRITRVDALLVELLATGVAAGLARLQQEQAALAAQVRFEQFFTPELARQLTAQPDLLTGRDCEVTLLFCDINGFSRTSERLGPATTVEWINDVMGTLSRCVLDQRGVLVDYLGDELIAMWGAPEAEPRHAALACQAALAMVASLPELNARWADRLGGPFSFGIGINTGIAQVGNTGSVYKFKYGPLGHTVNLASRVQGATKYLKTRVLLTGATHAQLDIDCPCRRLCTVRVVNLSAPVELYELLDPGIADGDRLRETYEAALVEFEQGSFRTASALLAPLLTAYPEDGATPVLLARALEALMQEGEAFDPVWSLPGK